MGGFEFHKLTVVICSVKELWGMILCRLFWMAIGKLVGLFPGYFLMLVGLKYFLIVTFVGISSSLLRIWHRSLHLYLLVFRLIGPEWALI